MAVARRKLVPPPELDPVEELGDDLVLLPQPLDRDPDRDRHVVDFLGAVGDERRLQVVADPDVVDDEQSKVR